MSTENASSAGQASAEETQSGLDENVAGALAYILGLLSGLFFFVTEKENEFVRFTRSRASYSASRLSWCTG
ncbi:MAG: hypothetical protein U5J64_07430 [Halobacteriales archaeon]|nr:hypothetical protein [Halobacteriales archaeon]